MNMFSLISAIDRITKVLSQPIKKQDRANEQSDETTVDLLIFRNLNC
jgi:hypothetical protein